MSSNRSYFQSHITALGDETLRDVVFCQYEVDSLTTSPSVTSQTIGKSFDPKGKVVQEGIDTNTLKPGKKLDTLDSNRLKNAVKYAGDKPIIVDRNGNVLDGHHRLNDDIQNNRAVDVQIGY